MSQACFHSQPACWLQQPRTCALATAPLPSLIKQHRVLAINSLQLDCKLFSRPQILTAQRVAVQRPAMEQHRKSWKSAGHGSRPFVRGQAAVNPLHSRSHRRIQNQASGPSSTRSRPHRYCKMRNSYTMSKFDGPVHLADMQRQKQVHRLETPVWQTACM